MSKTIRQNNSQDTLSAQISIEQSLRAEIDSLKNELTAMSEKHQATLATLAEIQGERDIYHRAVLHAMKREVPFTVEEVQEALNNRVDFAEFLQELGVEV